MREVLIPSACINHRSRPASYPTWRAWWLTIDLDRDISPPKLGKKVDKHEAARPIDDPFAFEGHTEDTEDFGERFLAAATPLTSAAKLKTLVDNLTAKELDELIKTATDRKNAEIAGARASFLDEVKSRAAKFWDVACRPRRPRKCEGHDGRRRPGCQISQSRNRRDLVGSRPSGEMDHRARG